MTRSRVDGGVVVCPQVVAAEAGVGVLRAGGNAVDAAIATAFVQAVVDPPMAGLGGFGVLLMRSAGGVVTGLDFHARAGAKATPGQWEHLAGERFDDKYGYVVDGMLNDIGYQSIGVPGMVAGLGEAHERAGSLPWATLLEPAVRVAEEGFVLSHAVREFWGEPEVGGRASGYARMTATPAAAELFAPGGTLLDAGARCVQPDLARTLGRIAAHGYREFYQGELARELADDLAAGGSHVTAEDLASFRANEFAPIRTGYRGHTVYGAPPPSGGLVLAQILRVLERFDLAALGHGTPESVVLLVTAMRHAVGLRERFGADPDFVPIDQDGVLSDAAIDEFLTGEVPAGAGSRESPNTTQVCVVDDAGNAVSLTHSLGYGSGVVSPGLGVLFNNYLNVFNPRPGFVDSIAPGKRRSSAMAPTIVTDAAGEPSLVAGAPGATRITTAVLHAVIGVLDFGLSPFESVAAPRVDWQGTVVEAEGRITPATVAALRDRGFQVNHRPRNYDPYFARAQLVTRAPDGWAGASDPRRDGGIALHA